MVILQLIDGVTAYKTNPDMDMRNSGIICINYSDIHLLKEALTLCDYIYSNYNLRESEQVALSLVFQNSKTVKSAEDVVFHYWFIKEARYILENYFYFNESKYNLPVNYMDEFVINEIRSVVNWNFTYYILFSIMVCIIRKKWKNTIEVFTTNIANKGFLKMVTQDDEYYLAAKEKVKKFYK